MHCLCVYLNLFIFDSVNRPSHRSLGEDAEDVTSDSLHSHAVLHVAGWLLQSERALLVVVGEVHLVHHLLLLCHDGDRVPDH